MSLPPDFLLRVPEESVRRICLNLLDEARLGARRLDDPDDEEALHDFRVAVRRLRSTVRAWRDELRGSVKKRHRRELKGLQNATGSGRDAEVALEWLDTQQDDLAPEHAAGFAWQVERLRTRHREAMAHACEDVRAAFHEVEEDLIGAVATLHTVVHLTRPARPTPHALALAEKVEQHTEELVEHLLRIRSIEDSDEAHQARIMGKRLRYLVEPARAYTSEAGKVVKHCKRLQDVLGDLNDCNMQLEDLAAAREEADDVHQPGLAEIGRRVEERKQALHRRLEDEWLADGAAALRQETAALAAHLRRLAEPAVEIERKYLLTSLPDLPAGHVAVEIDQGWLPGKRLRERLRRRAAADATRYYRTVKLGEGVQRTEIEEETTPELFEALWALTEGCRVRKRRYVVPDGDRTWEIDEFLDRELFLAEVELDDPDAAVEIPPWLAPHVERDVTGAREYVNLNLAR